jgi:hypothetical protein
MPGEIEHLAMQQHPANAAHNPTHVLIRFGVRLTILIVLAFLTVIGFAEHSLNFSCSRDCFAACGQSLQARAYVRARAHPLG